MLLGMFRQSLKESEFLLTSPEEVRHMTVAQEREFLRPFVHNPDALFLLAQVGSQAVGVLRLAQAKTKKQAHVGELGITVLRSYWNLGIGRRMMQAMLHWVEEHPLIRVIQLTVFSGNERAIRMYTHLGFREKGRIDRIILQPDGGFQDLVYMTKWIKE